MNDGPFLKESFALCKPNTIQNWNYKEIHVQVLNTHITSDEDLNTCLVLDRYFELYQQVCGIYLLIPRWLIIYCIVSNSSVCNEQRD